jgi:two-component system sensor histidine kinase CpxA
MVTALERMMTSQQRLLSDISHELRTPLTRLQLGTACCAAAAVRAKSWSVSKPKRTGWTA